ncbi:MAG: hypothetical protein WDM90_00350 [Ferruginibacter sp.]
MKTILSTFIITLAFYTGLAQTGNVGVGTAAPGSKLTVNGSFAGNYKLITASTTLDVTDYYTAYNGNAAGTITLPAATAASPAAGNTLGRVYLVKNTSAFNLTIKASGVELIDNQSGTGLATITVSPGYFVTIVSKGTTTGTTWEVAFTSSSNEAAKPQMAVVTATGNGPSNPNNNIARGAVATSTPIKSDVVLVNTIVGATYTQQTGTTPGILPYLLELILYQWR